jgi:hypothetical protein
MSLAGIIQTKNRWVTVKHVVQMIRVHNKTIELSECKIERIVQMLIEENVMVMYVFP